MKNILTGVLFVLGILAFCFWLFGGVILAVAWREGIGELWVRASLSIVWLSILFYAIGKSLNAPVDEDMW